MLITVETQAELAAVRGRIAALAHAIGPWVEIQVMLPCGTVVQHHRGGLEPAAVVASWNERIEDAIDAQESRGSW